MRVLVLSPHTDDGELGAGGTIARLAEKGARVFYVAFSNGTAQDREVMAATQHLGIEADDVKLLHYPPRLLPDSRQAILDHLIYYRETFMPDLVFAPARHTHQDHETVRMEAVRAFKQSTLLGYPQIWNDVVGFIPQCFYRLGERHIRAKVSAFACYASQRERSYGDPEILRGIALMYGTAIGTKYAEAFEVVRWVV